MVIARAFLLCLIPLIGTSVRQNEEVLQDLLKELPPLEEVSAAQTPPAAGDAPEPAPEPAPEAPLTIVSDAPGDDAPSDQAAGRTDAQILDETCNSAALNSFGRISAWRRVNKCKCKKGYQLVCPGQDCDAIGRYFRPENYKDKNCICDFCAKRCSDIVPGAVFRNSAWRRFSLKCKCPRTEVVRGSDEACHGVRYFGLAQMREKGCECTDSNSTAVIVDPNEPSTPAPHPTTTYVPEAVRIYPDRSSAPCGGALAPLAALAVAAALAARARF